MIKGRSKFVHYKQLNQMDCGPTCLRMVAGYYGRHFSLGKLREMSDFSKDGVSLLGISNAAERIGIKTIGVKISFEQLLEEIPKPCILHWNQNHFIVVPPQKISKKTIKIADPASEILTISIEDFKKSWIQTENGNEQYGIALALEPTEKFYEEEDEKQKKIGWSFLFKYIKSYKRYILQLVLGILIGSILQLVLPFLTQSIVDTGINTHNLQFINIILIAQFTLFLSRTIVDFIKSRILLFISTHINISILSDFWIKLMRLPMQYFDTNQTGDILQRINDHHRIESFLTGSTLSTLFSLFTLFIFSIVLFNYDWHVFFIFAIGSTLYFLWISIFLKYRRQLDYKRFAVASKENSVTMQLIYGMQEIKLNHAEHLRRWEWENVQGSLFKLNFKSLSLSQYQQAGAFFINEGKNFLITFFVAKAVLDGNLTLGAMLAIQYIIGQLNSPIEQLIGFMQQAQDAKISLERLNEIHELEDEEPIDKPFINQLPENKSVYFKNLSFSYPGAGNEPVIENLNLTIPEGKVTAIVGMSGSGKTTLLKLLLKFYTNYTGEIRIGESNHKNFSASFWRGQCGNVMQEGYIFSDTIAKNIAVGDEYPDHNKLLNACKIANIQSFVDSLPLGFHTKIGSEGNGISQGQKQRVLIARAVYKNPRYLFFDEATSALDANNEKEILENLEEFCKGRTVIVVAHRLSTVTHADKIVVLHKGQIQEEGTHEELSAQKGYYYELVKNQLELGN